MRILILLLILPVTAWAESRCERPQSALDDGESAEWSSWTFVDAGADESIESTDDPRETRIDHDALMAEHLDLGVEEIRRWRERSEELAGSLQADGEQVDRGIREARLRHADRLARRGDPVSLVGAALVSAELQSEPANARALAWLERAAASAPNDARPLWAAQALCAWAIDACDRRPWLERLVALEPDNGAAWVQLLAVTAPDEPAHEQAIENALSANRYVSADSVLRPVLFDSYDGLELDTRLSADFARLLNRHLGDAAPVDGDLESLPALIGAMHGTMLLSQAYPDPLTSFCGAAEQDSIRLSRADTCLRLHQRRFESTTTLVDRATTLLAITQLLAHDARAGEWEARQRRHQWQQTQSSRMLMARPERTLDPLYWRTFREQGEIAAIEQLLSSTGTPLDPPMEWDMERAQRDMMREMVVGSDAPYR